MDYLRWQDELKRREESSIAKGKLYTEEQIVRVLKEIEAAETVAAVCLEHNFSEPTMYPCQSKYGRLEQTDLHRLKALEDENQRLKQLKEELSLEPAYPPGSHRQLGSATRG